MKYTVRFYLAALILTATLFLSLAVLGTLIFANVLGIDRPFGIGFYLGALAVFGFVVSAIRGLYDRVQLDKQLELENLYTLGQRTNFFNLYQFEARVRAIRNTFRNRKKRQFVIDFGFAPNSISSNPRHSEEISAFNYAIAELLTHKFYGDKKNRKLRLYSSNSFCFHRGSFLIYSCCSGEEEVKDLCTTLLSEIYALGEQESVRVLVQPFFGIYETSPRDNLTFAIDNAQIARINAEDTFDTICFYHESFRVTTSKDDIKELEDALTNEELVVYYQPKFSLKEKRVVSSEALVRWNSPKYGLLSPASFIEKAENAGLISNIDLYVFEHALIDLAEQRKKGRRIVPVSVNFSLYEFFSPNFLTMFKEMLEKYKIPPVLVEVEITETTSQSNQFMSVSIIKKLKDLGVRVLMDDFGIGYSGIDNLRKIPFDAIKIDKSFTDLIVQDEKTRSIVKLINDLGHLNDIEVIVEGVDSQAEIDILKKIRVDTIQGYYYSKPLPLNEFEQFLKENPFEGKGAKA